MKSQENGTELESPDLRTQLAKFCDVKLRFEIPNAPFYVLSFIFSKYFNRKIISTFIKDWEEY